MTKAAPKLTLAPPQTIPLDKLALHEGNVRQIKGAAHDVLQDEVVAVDAEIKLEGSQSPSLKPLAIASCFDVGRFRLLRLAVLQRRLGECLLARTFLANCRDATRLFVRAPGGTFWQTFVCECEDC